MTLVRNPHWDQSMDKVRKNLLDVLAFQFGLDANVITDRLIQDKGADKQSVTFDNVQVPAAQIQQVLTNPQLKARTFGDFDP
jgi:hypothetical protein